MRIGNSMGVRIPKAIREQAGLKKKVTLTVTGDGLVIKARRTPRAGWAESIERAKSDTVKDESIWTEWISNEFDETEWQW